MKIAVDNVEFAGVIRNAVCTTSAVLGLAVVVLVSPAYAQNLVGNAGFEDATLDIWTLTGNAGLTTYSAYNGIGGSGELPAYGANFVAFNGGNQPPNAVLAQSFATTAGVRYTVDFLYGNFSVSVSGPTTQAVGVSAYNGSLTAAQISSSAPASIVTQVFTNTVPGGSTNFSTLYGTGDELSFVATGATTTLAFADQSSSTTSSSDGALDNVSVTAAASSPEPSAFLLLGGGAIPFSGFVLRRNRTSRSR